MSERFVRVQGNGWMVRYVNVRNIEQIKGGPALVQIQTTSGVEYTLVDPANISQLLGHDPFEKSRKAKDPDLV